MDKNLSEGGKEISLLRFFMLNRRGGALVYIMIAIALLAALTMAFIQPSGQSTSTQNSFKLATELNSQARLIRSAIQDCILRFPKGDPSITATNYFHPYPLQPNSPQFDDRADYAGVQYLKCPGTGSGTDVDDQERIFGGTLSTFLPPPPAFVNARGWVYANGTGANQGETYEGVYFRIYSDNSDPFIEDAFQKLDDLFSECEADYIVGNGSNGVESGKKSFRVWIIRKQPAC